MLFFQVSNTKTYGVSILPFSADMQIAAGSDLIIDLGPGAGRRAGELPRAMFQLVLRLRCGNHIAIKRGAIGEGCAAVYAIIYPFEGRGPACSRRPNIHTHGEVC